MLNCIMELVYYLVNGGFGRYVIYLNGGIN